MKTLAIAMLCHSINAAYCRSLGDDTQPSWDDAPDWQRNSAIAGVEMHLANPDATPEQSHESWYAQKQAEGWKYGDVKDVENKLHPCFLPYDELPQEQKAKDYLFRETVHLMKHLPDIEEYLALVDEVKNLRQKQQSNVSIMASQPSLGKATGIPVQYVGKKSQYTDRLYGSNLVFGRGQVRNVPSDIASKLLNHPEFQHYEQHLVDTPVNDRAEILHKDDTQTILDQAQIEQNEKLDEENRTMDEIEIVNRMDKKSLIDYAQTKYDQKLDGRNNVGALREHVVGLINQFGVV